jgi:hypothetical protein
MESLGNQIDHLHDLMKSILALFITMGGIFLALSLMGRSLNRLLPLSKVWGVTKLELSKPGPLVAWIRKTLRPISLWIDAIASGQITVALLVSTGVIVYGCMVALAMQPPQLLARLGMGMCLIIFLVLLTKFFFRHFQEAMDRLV